MLTKYLLGIKHKHNESKLSISCNEDLKDSENSNNLFRSNQ